MLLFEYRGIRNGIASGYVRANNDKDAIKYLRSIGIDVISIYPVDASIINRISNLKRALNKNDDILVVPEHKNKKPLYVTFFVLITIIILITMYLIW